MSLRLGMAGIENGVDQLTEPADEKRSSGDVGQADVDGEAEAGGVHGIAIASFVFEAVAVAEERGRKRSKVGVEGVSKYSNVEEDIGGPKVSDGYEKCGEGEGEGESVGSRRAGGERDSFNQPESKQASLDLKTRLDGWTNKLVGMGGRRGGNGRGGRLVQMHSRVQG